MKKVLLLAIVCCFAAVSAKAQVNAHSWIATVSIPSPSVAFLKFSNDTLELITTEDNQVVETMTYKLASDTLTLLKVSGGSPCDATKPVYYKTAIKEDQLIFTNVNDECDPRIGALTGQPWKLKK